MDLIYLHGAPASGKLTIAKEVQQLTSATLFDNHAAIDFVKTIFEFGVPPFWDAVHETRMLAFTMAARSNLPLMIYTSCYAHPEDLPLYQQIENVVASNGGKILPVFLECSMAAREQRVGNADRISRKKISSAEGLRKFDDNRNIAAVPRSECIHLNSETHSAADVAKQIVSHFNLSVI